MVPSRVPLQAARSEVAALIGARPSDVVHVANATAAANAVIQSTALRRGDLLMMTSLTYPAVRPCPCGCACRALQPVTGRAEGQNDGHNAPPHPAAGLAMQLLSVLRLLMMAGEECACQGGSQVRRGLAGGAAAAADAAAGCQGSACCLPGSPASAQVDYLDKPAPASPLKATVTVDCDECAVARKWTGCDFMD